MVLGKSQIAEMRKKTHFHSKHKTHPSYNFPTGRFQRCTQRWLLRQKQRQPRPPRNSKSAAPKKTKPNTTTGETT